MLSLLIRKWYLYLKKNFIHFKLVLTYYYETSDKTSNKISFVTRSSRKQLYTSFSTKALAVCEANVVPSPAAYVSIGDFSVPSHLPLSSSSSSQIFVASCSDLPPCPPEQDWERLKDYIFNSLPTHFMNKTSAEQSSASPRPGGSLQYSQPQGI